MSVSWRTSLFVLLVVLFAGDAMRAILGTPASVGVSSALAQLAAPDAPPAPPENPQPAASGPAAPAPDAAGPKVSAEAEKTGKEYLSAQETQAKTQGPKRESTSMPSALELYQKGGVLMYPITFLSAVVICFGLERFLGLRRRKVLPRRLVEELEDAADEPGGFNVAKAAVLCKQFPCSLARVVEAMMVRAEMHGGDLEPAIADACEREATRLYFHVRWLNLAMSVAPMLGLMGTVQGMIMVFMGASQPGVINKAEYMAEGIYLKLVCTFAGLTVAIPAALLSYLFEARIQNLMTGVEDFVRGTLLRPYAKAVQQRAKAAEPVEAAEETPVTQAV